MAFQSSERLKLPADVIECLVNMNGVRGCPNSHIICTVRSAIIMPTDLAEASLRASNYGVCTVCKSKYSAAEVNVRN